MSRDLSDRYERELQRRHEERTAFPLLPPGWLRQLRAAGRRFVRRLRRTDTARSHPPVPSHSPSRSPLPTVGAGTGAAGPRSP